MDTDFRLPELPIPPSVNDAYASLITPKRAPRFPLKSVKDVMLNFYPRRVLTKDAELYKQTVSNILNATGTTTRLREFVQAHGTVDIWFYVYGPNWYTQSGNPNRNAGDVDNRMKLLQDTLFSCIGVDDACVFFSGCRKMPGESKHIHVILRKTPDEVDEL